MTGRRSTIGDVANLAGVSIATVSRVLNDGSASEEAQKKVLDAAELLGYATDSRSKDTTPSTSNRVGILLSHFTESYSTCLLDALIDNFSDLKYDVLICSTVGHEGREAKYLRELTQNNVDALVTMSLDQHKYLPGVDALRIPHVIITGDAGDSEMTSAVRTDDESGMTQAFEHLRSLGHERIAHITGDLRQISARERRDTYLALMADAGLADDELVVEGNYLRPSGRAGAEALLELDEPPTAIITGNDSQLLGALELLEERYIAIPRQISVVGFDDIPEMAKYIPPITSVAQPLDEVGRLVAEEVHSRVSERGPATTSTVPMNLMVRDSTGPVPTA